MQTGQAERAEEIRKIHGIGEPKFRVLSQFMRSYSYQGDVASERIYYFLLYNWRQVKSNLPVIG